MFRLHNEPLLSGGTPSYLTLLYPLEGGRGVLRDASEKVPNGGRRRKKNTSFEPHGIDEPREDHGAARTICCVGGWLFVAGTYLFFFFHCA